MAQLKNIPETSPVGTTNWDQLFVLAGHWKSDLEFYLEDLKFLKRLIGRHSLWVRSSENTRAVNSLLHDLQQLSNKGENILQLTQDHLVKMTAIIADPSEGHSKPLSEDHARLEKALAGYVKEFRTQRRAAYKITEQVLNSEDHNDPLGEPSL